MPVIPWIVGGGPYKAPQFDTARIGASITLSESYARATSSGPAANYDYAFVTNSIAGRVYGEVEVVSASGANNFVGIGDDDPALAANGASAMGDGTPGWGWRADGSGFSATTPGSFVAGDVLQFRLDTHSRSVELAKNNGAWAAAATFAAGSGDVIWRPAVFWFAGSSGSLRLPATPTYTVPAGYAWWGNLPIY